RQSRVFGASLRLTPSGPTQALFKFAPGKFVHASFVLSPTSLSANPSLHSSLRLKNNVPEKVNVKTKRKNQNLLWVFV
ncbi:MAG: hypothetical protein E6995_18765, partial [Enterobacteriaceae bacterium]|nr:hypothetical protein [Enterobacteriaceae bacterium]MDU1246258.1 hypothetical protein [Enterobacteriaceae bacterium]